MTEEKINSDLLTALKNKDSLKASVLRLIKASIGNKKIIGHGEISKEDIMSAIKTELKQANETLEAMIVNNRDPEEQVKKIEIIKSYLPKQLNKHDLVGIIDTVIAETNSKNISDMGKVIGIVMGQTKSMADGSIVSKLVKEKLS